MNKRIRKQTTYEGAQSMTQQCFRSQCNIQDIINRSKISGKLPENTEKGFFGDFAGVDFQGMQNLVAQAQQGFDALHPSIRRRFNNDPALLIEFVNNDENYAEGVKLGLVKDRGNSTLLDVTVPTDTILQNVSKSEVKNDRS